MRMGLAANRLHHAEPTAALFRWLHASGAGLRELGVELHAVGRTHDAIARWLPNRTTIVVTSHPEAVELPDGERARGIAVSGVDEAIETALGLDDVVYVAGGGTIYRQAWPRLTQLDLTEVHATAPGSVFFPEVDPAEWVETSREPHDGFDFVGYRRILP